MKAALATTCLLLGGCLGDAQATVPLRPAPPVPVTADAHLGPDAARVYTDGAVATTALAAAVGSAQHSIDAEIYEFDRRELVEGMLAATRRGVLVRVVADPTVPVTVGTGRRLAAAGARVAFFPVSKRQIDHVKLLVVDGAVAFFGGMNWGARSYRNRDYELRLAGPAVARLEHLFSLDLQRSRAGSPGVPAPPPIPGEPALLTSYPDDEVGRAVLAALRGAAHRIDLEMFVLTDPDTIRALQSAARRGVAVRALLDPGQDLNQAAVAELRTAGVSCRFYRSSGEKLHAKAAVIDGARLIVGSANWTASGFRHNHELDAILTSPTLAGAVKARMDADWQAAA